MRSVILLGVAMLILLPLCGCYTDEPPKPYGVERPLVYPGNRVAVWAVAPAINLSGHREVDPILQADLVFQEVQEVRGITGIPVNRVAQVYAGLGIRQVESPQQAAQVCDLLGADALVVPTVTAYDPYSPPKMAASLLLFRRTPNSALQAADQRDPAHAGNVSALGEMKQAVGIFDASDGSVRAAMQAFAAGRSDPNGPMAEREYFLSMDAYTGFVYHSLIADLLGVPREPAEGANSSSSTGAHGRSGR